MSLINSSGFRLPFNRVWSSQYTLNFNRLHYSRLVATTFAFLTWLPKFFNKPIFVKYEFVYSHLLMNKNVNNALTFQIFYFSRFFVGLTRFLNFVLRKNARLLSQDVSLVYYTLFVQKLIHLHTLHYFYFIRFSLFKVIKSFFNADKNNCKIVLRSLDRQAFPASYIGMLIKRRMRSRSNLARLVIKIAHSFQKINRSMWKAIRITVSGRFSRQQRAQTKTYTLGVVAANTLSSKVDYSSVLLTSRYGQSTARIWINYK